MAFCTWLSHFPSSFCADLIDHSHARGPSVAASPPRHRIYLCAGATESTLIEPLFNTQLYHLHGAVRTGESSGSVHTRACVPVIFEMNGAERVERLEVVRVPYANAADADSALFDQAAERIVALASGGECVRMLARNADRAAALSAEYVAARYAAIFEELAR